MFFGKEGYKHEAGAYKKYIETLLSINKTSLDILADLKIDKDDIQQKVACCLFRRLLEGAQSAIVLISRGLDLDAAVVMRVMFETLVYLKKCCDDKNFIGSYIKKGKQERLRLCNIIINNPNLFSEMGNLAQKDKIIKMKNEIALKLKDAPYPSLPSIEVLAKDVGLIEQYKTFYCLVSQISHVNVRSLSKSIDDGLKLDWKTLSLNPNYQNIERDSITVGEFLISADDSVCNLFGLTKNNLNYLIARLTKLAKSTN